jgi:hypothetical protein
MTSDISSFCLGKKLIKVFNLLIVIKEGSKKVNGKKVDTKTNVLLNKLTRCCGFFEMLNLKT